MAPDTLERSLPPLKDPSLLRQQCYLDGKWQNADSGATHPVINPATGKLIGTSPIMGAAETKRAIAAANAAWPAWRDKTAKERSAILRKWFELMLANVDDLALILTTEQGQAARRIQRRGRQSARGTSSGSPRKRGASTATSFPTIAQRPPARRDQAAGRRLRGDHAVELPVVDDHAQGRAGARRRAAPS